MIQRWFKGLRVAPIVFGAALPFFLMALSSCANSVSQPGALPDPVTHHIVIKKFKFLPETLVIRRGDVVKWENRDIVPHQIAEKSLRQWKSQELKAEDMFTRQIEGEVSYICKLHPTMKGKIVLR